MNLIKFLLIFLVLSSCSNLEKQVDPEEKNSTPIIYTSNYPLYFFTKQMTGEDFEIRFPAKAAGDPTFWNPTPEEISEMKAADLIFLNGASYENWLLCCLLG